MRKQGYQLGIALCAVMSLPLMVSYRLSRRGGTSVTRVMPLTLGTPSSVGFASAGGVTSLS